MENISVWQVENQISIEGRTFWDREKGLIYLSFTLSTISFQFTGTYLIVDLFSIPGTEPFSLSGNLEIPVKNELASNCCNY